MASGGGEDGRGRSFPDCSVESSRVMAERAISRKQARAKLFPHSQNLSPSLEPRCSDRVVLR